MRTIFAIALAVASLVSAKKSAPIQPGGQYKIAANLVGDQFYDAFTFYNHKDPTNGRVQYVDQATAQKHNLTHASSSSFIIRADSKSKVASSAMGRMSVRLHSKDRYKTHTSVLDLRHMPQGRGTWPAYWMNGDNWPNGGELDIIEGVNDQDHNLSSLHTSPGCTQPQKGRLMKGSVGATQCDAKKANNQGCGVVGDSPRSFGPKFNQNGGGWYATERTEHTIKIWFWSRSDTRVPADVRENTGTVSPSKWGNPTVSFVSDSCDIAEKYGPNQFIINLTLCGDWAGSAFPGGKSACNKFVNNNPAAFKDAYWDIARLSVYE